MRYEVTATRKRPQAFNDLAGQQFVAETLQHSIGTGTIAHAYIFSGPRGVGKTSTARILAKSLNCQEKIDNQPCGKCSSCIDITRGNALDVIEIDGASNTGVDDIRDIKESVLYPPNSSPYKIFIIDEVHMLSNSAFNALLKTIEEPPPYIIFIFATTEIHKIPATVKSRCQQFNFRLMSPQTIIDLLTKALTDLNIEIEEEVLQWIARESTGSMRDAYTLFDQIISFAEDKKKITFEDIRSKMGLISLEQTTFIFDALAEGKRDIVLNKCHEIIGLGISVEQFISDTIDYLRNLLLIKSGIDDQNLLGYSIERYSIKAIERWNLKQIEHAFMGAVQLYKDLRFTVNPLFELELYLSRLCSLSYWVEASDLINELNLLKRDLKEGIAPEYASIDSLDESVKKKL